MSALHDETRSRWGAYPPDRFVAAVLHGALRDKINLASMVIHVYTQIIHQFPGTASMQVTTLPDAPRLRDLFKSMRACIADAQEMVRDDAKTLLLPYTPEGYILDTVCEIRRYIANIDRWAAQIEADATLSEARLPSFKGKTIGDIAAEILQHLADVTQMLDFAHSYAEIKKTVSKPSPSENALHRNGAS